MTTDAEQVARPAAGLGSVAPWPADGGEPVFAEPWEGRAFAMALDVVDRGGLSWDDFRAHLVAAIADDPHRPYYESWVIALEHLVLATDAVTTADLDRARSRAGAYRYEEEGLGDVEAFPLQVAVLPELLDAMSLAVDASGTRHLELYRTWVDGAPASWGVRSFDGGDDVLLDVPLPSPFLDADGDALAEPDWSRLARWDHLRHRFLGVGPDPADRLGRPPRPS